MTTQVRPASTINLAASTYALCLYADGTTIAANLDARFHLPFQDEQACTPIGQYRVAPDDGSFSVHLDENLLARAIATAADARAIAVSHYASRAVAATFSHPNAVNAPLKMPLEA